jgi:fatty-acyl-CoA synthase
MSHIVRDWVGYHASRTADDVVLSDLELGTSLTWAELDTRVGALAYALQVGMSLRRGDRVALISDNDTRIFELQFACMRAGLILVPLNWRLTAHELIELLRNAGPSALVHDAVWEAKAVELASALGIGKRMAWGCSDGAIDYEEAIRARDGIAAPHSYDPDTVTHIMYTSGTTGIPEGAMCTHGTLMWQALNLAHTSRMAEEGGHHLNIVPLFHAGGLNVYSNPMLFWGGRVSTINRFDPAVVLELLTDEKMAVTHLCGVLQMYELITALPNFGTAVFPSLRCGLFGGWGPQTRWVHEQWRNRGVFLQLSYGATELGPNVSVLQSGAAEAEKNSSGPAMPFTELRLVDPGGSDVDSGDVGEIWVKGPAVTPGYWGRSGDDCFEDGWFKTGDCGRFDSNGHLFVVDRLREVYRSGGENVYPAEVEAVLAAIPEIHELAIIGVPDDRWGEVGLAVVVPTDGAEVTLETLIAFAADKLAKYKFPKHVVVVDELPRNVTLKIARDQLRTHYAERFGAVQLAGATSQTESMAS